MQGIESSRGCQSLPIFLCFHFALWSLLSLFASGFSSWARGNLETLENHWPRCRLQLKIGKELMYNYPACFNPRVAQRKACYPAYSRISLETELQCPQERLHSTPFIGFLPLPFWLPHFLSVFPGIISQIKYWPLQPYLRIGFWENPAKIVFTKNNLYLLQLKCVYVMNYKPIREICPKKRWYFVQILCVVGFSMTLIILSCTSEVMSKCCSSLQ